MELKKNSENINRNYDAEGKTADRIESVNYTLLDAEGNAIGSANVWNGSANISISISGFGSIEDGEAKVKEILGI